MKIGSFKVLVRLDSSWENIKIHFLPLADKTKQLLVSEDREVVLKNLQTIASFASTANIWG